MQTIDYPEKQLANDKHPSFFVAVQVAKREFFMIEIVVNNFSMLV
jgi:hypothetical protein